MSVPAEMAQMVKAGTVLECHGVRNSVLSDCEDGGTVLECHGVRNSLYYLNGKIEVQY